MQENSKMAPEIKNFLTEIEHEKMKPQKAKSTMSVREMAGLLGIHKTDSYWLISKHFFKTIQMVLGHANIYRDLSNEKDAVKAAEALK